MSPVGMTIARITIGMQNQHQADLLLYMQLLNERKLPFSVDVDFVFVENEAT